MSTLALHHHSHTTPLRVLDFVVLALFALSLAFIGKSDMQAEPTNSVYSPAP